MEQFDTIIVGGGLSGILTAAKIQQKNPALKMALLEADRALGGRLTSLDKQQRPWAYGFCYLHKALFEFIDSIVKDDPAGEDLKSFCPRKLQKFSILAGGKQSEFLAGDFLSQKSFKAFGGVTAAKEWPEIEKLFAEKSIEEKDFNHIFPISKKSSSAMVLESYARFIGLSDFWHATPQIFTARSQELSDGMHCGPWEKPLTEIVRRFGLGFELTTDCYVVSANFSEVHKKWHLKTQKGEFSSDKLIVAQSPWQALTWLTKATWPTAFLNLANKSKPVSTVCVSYEARNIPPDLADITLIPSEDTCAVYDHDGHIIFQSHIDFEMSLQAPNVMKSVKSLHRAAKKFASASAGLELANEHIALVPVGWALSATAHDRKYFEKLDLTKLQQNHLMFVGDAYGRSLHGDSNILESIESALKIIN